MLDAFLVTARELTELLLCAQAVRVLLVERRLQSMLGAVRAGMALGLAASLVIALLLSAHRFDPFWSAAGSLAFGALMMSLSVGMLSSREEIQDGVRHRLSDWLELACRPWVIAAFMAALTLREGLEVFFFLQADSGHTAAAALTTGITLGVAVALSAAWLYRRVETRGSLLAAFHLSALLLALVAIEMLVGGVAALARLQAGQSSPALAVSAAHAMVADDSWTLWLSAGLMAFVAQRFVRAWWTTSRATP